MSQGDAPIFGYITPILGYIKLNTHTHVCRHVHEEHIYHLSFFVNSRDL